MKKEKLEMDTEIQRAFIVQKSGIAVLRAKKTKNWFHLRISGDVMRIDLFDPKCRGDMRSPLYGARLHIHNGCLYIANRSVSALRLSGGGITLQTVVDIILSYKKQHNKNKFRHTNPRNSGYNLDVIAVNCRCSRRDFFM